MEQFGHFTGLLPEQLWDHDDLPDLGLFRGQASGSAMPLAWAHAEYTKLVRSVGDGQVFDRIPEVADRYLNPHTPSPLEVWNFSRKLGQIPKGATLRVPLAAPFRLHWTYDNWQTVKDTDAAEVPGTGIFYVDVPTTGLAGPLIFTFFWTAAGTWEPGNPFQVALV
jgi:glucoamylase